MVVIRDYTDDDYDAVEVMLKEAGHYRAEWCTPEHLHEKITRSPDSIVIAEADGRVIGTQFIVEDGWSAFLFRLCVHKDFQHHGIGKQLIQEAERRLRKKGVKRVSFFVRDHQLKKLQPYYEKLGYSQGNSCKSMYKEL